MSVSYINPYMDLNNPSTWFTKLKEVFGSLGFQQWKTNYSLFVCREKDSITIILAYVNDPLLIGDNLNNIIKTKQNLKDHFSIKDLGALKYFLGFDFSYCDNEVFVSQRKYALDLLSYLIFWIANLKAHHQ